jgi:predicted nucleotidyltransferase
MSVGGSASTLMQLAALAETMPGLELLMVFGSRGRGDAHADSDWDIGYLASADFDSAALVAGIVETVGSDRVDLVNLSYASGLLRFRAARDGYLVFEARPRLAEQYRLDAAQFWCDAAPVLQRGYDAVLEGLSR